MSNIPLLRIHLELVRKHVCDPTDENELLLWMVLIHTHQINLALPCIQDAPDLRMVQPVTQRAAAGVISDLWPKREDQERTSYVYWYRAYQLRTPYETMDAVPPEAVATIEILRRELESDPRVESIMAADR
jgi:hypothetical protein